MRSASAGILRRSSGARSTATAEPGAVSAFGVVVLAVAGFTTGSLAGWVWGLFQHPGTVTAAAAVSSAEDPTQRGVVRPDLSSAAPGRQVATSEAGIGQDPAEAVRQAGARARERLHATGVTRPVGPPPTGDGN